MDTDQQLVETFLFTQSPSVNIRIELDPDVITGAVPIDDAFGALPLTNQIVGGCQSYGVLLPDFNYHCGDYQLVWQIELLGASVLHLCEFSVTTGSTHTISIELPAPAVPKVAFSAAGDHVYAYVVLRNGVILTLPFIRPSISGHKASGLKTLKPECISQFSLHEHRSTLGSPTGLALVSQSLCVAGKSSSILCIPLDYIRTQDQNLRPFELRGSSWALQPILHGVLSKQDTLGFSGLFAFKFGLDFDLELLGSVRQDGKVQLWDVQKRSQVPVDFPHEPQHALSKEPSSGLACNWVQLSRTDSVCFVQQRSRQAGLQTKCYKVRLEAGRFVAQPVQAPPSLMWPLLDAVVTRKRQSYQVWTLTSRVGSLDGGAVGFEGEAPEAQVLGFELASGQPLGQAVMAESWLQRCLTACGNSLDQDFETMFCSSNKASPQDCFLPLLLAPGLLSRAALCDALSMYGARLTPAEVQNAPLPYLRSCAEAAQLAIAQHNPGTSLNQAWSILSSTYLQCWRRRHSILRMVTLLDGSVLLVRAGLLVSVLRPARETEIGALNPNQDTAPSFDVMRLLQQLMGSHLLGLATAQLLAGVDARVQLVPMLVHMMMTGPVPVLTQPHSDTAATEQREWRKLRRQLLLMINASAEQTAAMIRERAEALIRSTSASEDTPMSSHPLPLEASGKQGPSTLIATLASTGGALIGWAQCAASLQLLVLAGLMDKLELLSATPSSPHLKTLDALTSHVQSATLTLWMCTHPATPGVIKEDASEALEVLSRLRLSPASAALPTPRTVSNCSLASSLLPLMCKQAPNFRESVQYWQEAASTLVVYLQQGMPGQYSHTSVSQFLKAGYLLFQAREVGCLAQLVKLAGESAQRSAGLLFLQGLGLACQVGQATGSARTQTLTQATMLFFRAASSFRSDEGGDLREMLSDLRRELVAGGEGEVQELEALLQLRLYEAVMLLFEREGAPDGAILFAQAAVEQLPAAYGDPLSEEGRKHAGRLWSHVFSCACELKDYDAAYVAALNNPEPRDSVECLRRLVHCCCDDGQYLKLCSLPFAGTATVERGGDKGKKAQLAFVQEAVNIVHKRARHAEISSDPSPYLHLYSFLSSRSCHRKAAAVMLEYAERLMQEGDGGHACIQKALRAYGDAIGSLELVEPASAWLQSSVGADRGEDTNKPPPVLMLEDLRKEFARLSAASTVSLHASSSPSAGVPSTPLAEYAHERSAEDLFQQLLSLHSYDGALTLAHNTWKGATLAAMIQRVLCALATLCVHCPDVQREEAIMFPEHTTKGPTPLHSPTPRTTDTVSYGVWPTGVLNATASWRSLERMLQVYFADRSTRGQLGLHGVGGAVADALLAADRRMALPPWLLDMLKAADSRPGLSASAADSAPLLVTYLKHERLIEAAALVLTHFNALATSDPRARERHAAIWMPHNIIAALRKRLEAAVGRLRNAGRSGDAGELEGVLRRLEAAIREHGDLMERHTQRLMAYGKAVAV